MREVILNIDVMGAVVALCCNVSEKNTFDLQTIGLDVFDVLGVHPPKRAL